MKKFVLFLVFIFALNINAQVQVQQGKLEQLNSVEFLKDKPVDVRLLYPDLEKPTQQYMQEHPDYKPANRMNKPEFNFTVGSTHTWFAQNLSTHNFYQVPSTCRAVGVNCYIFVEDSNWGTKVTQTAVDSVRIAFDSKCPANPSKGIYQMDVDTFGTPPNVDGDNKIVILILDIQDGYTPGNSYVAGYFHGWNELPASNYGSNYAEIYYLDCNPLDLTTSAGLKSGMSTTAHEFQHMIEYNYHPQGQTLFFNEGCSLLAEYICGYDFREQTSFANDSPIGLLEWRSGNDALKDYSRAARFMLYYYEQFGIGFFSKFVQSAYIGITGIDDALTKLASMRRFGDILPDWYIANAVDNKSVNPKWGYNLTGMPKPQGTTFWSSNINSYSANVPYLGARIITHKGSYSINSTFSNCNTTYHQIKAIKFGSGNPVIEDVPLNSTYSVSTLNPTYTSIQYLILNNSSMNDYSFTYGASGTNPPAYVFDYTVNAAVGSFGWNTGDTVCVYFDPIFGGKLDSIKVQFSKAGSLQGGVWEYTGSQRPTPLGASMISFTANPVNNSWTNIDLTSYGKSTSKAFAVAFPTLAGGVQVSVSPYPATSPYHSYTYLTSSDASSGVAGWYYVTKDASNIYIYQIKAYISVGTVGNEKTLEVLPSSYSLSQNYPNPFNPSTKIQYTLPENAKVTVRIYDMLGRVIKTLVSGEESAGMHQITWNGDNEAGQKVATGIYMYSISTNKFVQTKKMVLMK